MKKSYRHQNLDGDARSDNFVIAASGIVAIGIRGSDLYRRQCLPLVGLSNHEERHGLAIPSYPIPNAVFVTINNPVTREASFFDTKDEANEADGAVLPVTDRFGFFSQPS